MAYDLSRFFEADVPNRRTALTRYLYTAPFVILPLTMTSDIANHFGSPALSMLTNLLSLLGLAALLWALFSRFDGSPELLDEREQTILMQAQAQSYWLLLAGVFVAFGYGWVAMELDWWLPGTADDLWTLFQLFILAATLPTVVAEWRAPLPLADEDG